MKCPYQKIVTRCYNENPLSAAYGKVIKVNIEFEECCEKQCPFFKYKNKTRFDERAMRYRNISEPSCRKIESEVKNNGFS